MREHAAEGPAPAVTDDAAVAVAPAPPLTAPLTPSSLLGIQRVAGNRAAAALVARQPTAATAASLRSGSTGPEVSRLQMDLNLLDEVKTALAVDAIYGPITTGAVREFQAAHPPLKATGVADAGTQAAVEEAKAEEQDQTDIARKLFALGGKAYEKGKYGHAYAFFTRAQELAPRPQLTFSRAQALRRLGGRREEAIALYEEYLATDNPARKADAESALAELRTSPTGDETADTATGKAHFNKGAGQYEQGDFAHAYDQFTMAGELAPRSSLLFSRAQALRRLGGREAEAMELYAAYIEAGGERVEDARQMLELLRTHGAAP